MRPARLFFTVLLTLSASTVHTQSGASGGIGKLVAPGIEVLFSQSSPSSCTWRFRNADPSRTLQSMRFSYTWSASPVGRGPLSKPANDSGQDFLTESLAPFEESSAADAYRAPAACGTVKIQVTASQWT